MAESKKADEAKVEVPPGPLGADAQVKPADEMSKAELKEVLVNPADAKLHPAPGDAALEAEQGAQEDPDREPFASSGPAELLSGLAAGPGAHTPPDPDKFDAEGRPKKK
jgi:hypothetical protein